MNPHGKVFMHRALHLWILKVSQRTQRLCWVHHLFTLLCFVKLFTLYLEAVGLSDKYTNKCFIHNFIAFSFKFLVYLWGNLCVWQCCVFAHSPTKCFQVLLLNIWILDLIIGRAAWAHFHPPFFEDLFQGVPRSCGTLRVEAHSQLAMAAPLVGSWSGVTVAVGGLLEMIVTRCQSQAEIMMMCIYATLYTAIIGLTLCSEWFL